MRLCPNINLVGKSPRKTTLLVVMNLRFTILISYRLEANILRDEWAYHDPTFSKKIC